ncbi:hypothetical protein E2C01_052079 [Portunus trituberculatus]|uniref:Uncharacterized protein n=1 Tax=Portunus trituberculatus TaxID=210409 RepID=A0A5B7GNF4_PORTR|nr:hypothetical protein [Portunus trituberculatus]
MFLIFSHVFVLGDTYVTTIFLFFNSSVLIVIPITSTWSSPNCISSTHILS